MIECVLATRGTADVLVGISAGLSSGYLENARLLFTVSVTQDVYQAEEHDIMCGKRTRRLFLYNSKSELELYPEENFKGQVSCDVELAKKGRIECVFTELRLDDSGTYYCVVIVNERESGHNACELRVTAASDQPTKETPKPASRGRIGLCGFALFIVGAAALALRHWTFGHVQARVISPESGHMKSDSSFSEDVFVKLLDSSCKMFILRLWDLNTFMELKQELGTLGSVNSLTVDKKGRRGEM
ncbi:hypothetical protein L3Q82_003872 [Scortum barcoo]|uniref:Uncharacterized protein n=1 Tax=Scortum barcoo TaxID=214431 RepID=A0ACB8X6D0_9TELE|nr:hypothetical protein L3Q82_003872 [Scortum barcoo]